MVVEFTDYNGAGAVMKKNSARWKEISSVLKAMPLYLKESDQAGISGAPIFNPVGTNLYIKKQLEKLGWVPNVTIPEELDFLGTNIDFVKEGVILEVQFSNYPFLLNNIFRSEIFYKSKTRFSGAKISAVLIITKAHMFPSSNSTLYYEQAIKQVNSLIKFKAFTVPIRIIGLFEKFDQKAKVVWTKYEKARYSRTVANEEEKVIEIKKGKADNSRAQITL